MIQDNCCISFELVLRSDEAQVSNDHPIQVHKSSIRLRDCFPRMKTYQDEIICKIFKVQILPVHAQKRELLDSLV